jgi:hypothetical protein
MTPQETKQPEANYGLLAVQFPFRLREELDALVLNVKREIPLAMLSAEENADLHWATHTIATAAIRGTIQTAEEKPLVEQLIRDGIKVLDQLAAKKGQQIKTLTLNGIRSIIERGVAIILRLAFPLP